MDYLTVVARAMRVHYLRFRNGDTVHWMDRYTGRTLCGMQDTNGRATEDNVVPVKEPITCPTCREAFWAKREEALRTVSMPLQVDCHQ